MSRPVPSRARELDLEGLTHNCRPALVRFGQRNTGLVINVPGLRTVVDQGSGLTLFPLDDVFTEPPVLIGFGTPNTYLVVPDEQSPTTHKLSAFMFWRQASAVVPTKGRVQAGVLFELRGLPESLKAKLRATMHALSGRRSVSCAHLTGKVLASSGFTFGNGRSLTTFVRPSKFASLLWRHGLRYRDTTGTHEVRIRIIHASPVPFGDHFVRVWMREIDSPIRTVRKMFAKHPSVKAPTFETQNLPRLDTKRWAGPSITIGMARSDRLGAHMAFVLGQKPSYIVRFPKPILMDELKEPLKPFPVVTDTVTRLKRDVLFSKPVIKLINHSRLADIDWYTGNIKVDMAIDMLMPSPGPEYEQAMLYNCVVTPTEIRLTGLHTKESRNMNSKFIRSVDWIAAKHVLLSDYDPKVIYACELWAYRDEAGRPVVCINNNSGTYKPSVLQMKAFAHYLRTTFGIQVRTFKM